MTTIKLKNGSGAPTSGDLAQGEPALDLTNKRLYTEDSGGTVIEVGTNPGVDVTFADNRKAIFGAGSDLQIYHDGTNSQIVDAGAGILSIAGNSAVGIYSQGTGESMIIARSNAEVELYYDNAEKLATTSTGIQVGTFSGNSVAQISAGTTGVSSLYLGDGSSGAASYAGFVEYNHTGDYLRLGAGSTERARVTSTGIDVTGTVTADGLTLGSNHRIQGTGGLFLGGSSATVFEVGAGSEKMRLTSTGLGIGTSSPAAPLHISKSLDANATELLIENQFVSASSTDESCRIQSRFGGYDASYIITGKEEDWTTASNRSSYMSFTTRKDGTLAERMRIDSSGNVGIGISPDTLVHAYKASNAILKVAEANGYASLQQSGTNSYLNNVASGGSLIFRNGTAPTERMRIDSSGNVGIGTSSIPAGVRTKIKGLAEATNLATSATSAALFIEPYSDSSWGLGIGSVTGQKQYIQAVAAAGDGTKELLLQPFGGNVGIGNSSPSGYTGASANTLVVGSNIGNNGITVAAGTTGYSSIAFADSAGAGTTADYSGLLQYYHNTDTLNIFTAGAEAMRIDSSGRLLVGQTSGVAIGGTPADVNGTEIGPGYINLNRDDTVSATQIQFGKNGSVAGSIVTTTSTTYNTTSDQRAKENIADADDAGAVVDAIKVRKFDWKGDGTHQRYGMIAQELLESAPEVVHQPENPEEMMGVDYSKLVPMLVKEIQSLRARVAQLETN